MLGSCGIKFSIQYTEVVRPAGLECRAHGLPATSIPPCNTVVDRIPARHNKVAVENDHVGNDEIHIIKSLRIIKMGRAIPAL